jgi:hypothetical protein
MTGLILHLGSSIAPFWGDGRGRQLADRIVLLQLTILDMPPQRAGVRDDHELNLTAFAVALLLTVRYDVAKPREMTQETSSHVRRFSLYIDRSRCQSDCRTGDSDREEENL